MMIYVLLLATNVIFTQNQTTEGIRKLGKLFEKKRQPKDSLAFINNPSLSHLEGHWSGKYIINDFGPTTVEYNLYLMKISPTQYFGLAENEGYPIYEMYLKNRPKTKMKAFVLVENKDTLQCNNIEIKETKYFEEGLYQYWYLKTFKSELVPLKNKVKMTGMCNNYMNFRADMSLTKESDQIDEQHLKIFEDFKNPRLEITSLEFTNPKQRPTLDYLGSGEIKFLTQNMGLAPSPSVMVAITVSDDADKALYSDTVVINGTRYASDWTVNGIDATKSKYSFITIKANDRILSKFIKVAIAIKKNDGHSLICQKEITIPINQE